MSHYVAIQTLYLIFCTSVMIYIPLCSQHWSWDWRVTQKGRKVKFRFSQAASSVRGEPVASSATGRRWVADMAVPHLESNVARGVGAPVRHPARRGRHRVTDNFIEVETALAFYLTRFKLLLRMLLTYWAPGGTVWTSWRRAVKS
jgi:hypothetical protein